MGPYMAMLPGEALILALVATGFLVIFRVISGSLAATIIGSVLLLAILAPILGVLPDLLPKWALLLLLLVLGITLLRVAASLFIGRAASNFMTGILSADVVRFVITLPFRIARAIFGAVSRRNANR